MNTLLLVAPKCEAKKKEHTKKLDGFDNDIIAGVFIKAQCTTMDF